MLLGFIVGAERLVSEKHNVCNYQGGRLQARATRRLPLRAAQSANEARERSDR